MILSRRPCVRIALPPYHAKIEPHLITQCISVMDVLQRSISICSGGLGARSPIPSARQTDIRGLWVHTDRPVRCAASLQDAPQWLARPFLRFASSYKGAVRKAWPPHQLSDRRLPRSSLSPEHAVDDSLMRISCLICRLYHDKKFVDNSHSFDGEEREHSDVLT